MFGSLHRVAINAHEALAFFEHRKQREQLFLHALRAEPEHRHALAALRTDLGKLLLCLTVMTAHPLQTRDAILMANHARIALGALRGPAATLIRARDVVRVAATIEEQEHLTLRVERLLHASMQHRSDEMNLAISKLPAF